MEDRQQRLLLSVILSLGIWFVVQYFVFPPAVTKKNPVKDVAKDSLEVKENKTAKEVKTSEVAKDTVKTVEFKSIDQKDIQKFYIETSSYLVQFSSVGGRIEKFYIKNYPDLEGNEVRIIKNENEFISFSNGEFGNGKFKAIEISREKGFDFAITDNKNELSSSLYNFINFTPIFDEKNKVLNFTTDSVDKKFIITKTYSFFQNENYFKFNLNLKNKTTEKLIVASREKPIYFRPFGSLGPVKLQDVNDRDQAHYYRFYFVDGSFQDNIEGASLEGFFSKAKTWFGGKADRLDPVFDILESPAVEFFGNGSRYFIAALNPLDKNKPTGIILDNRKGNTLGTATIYHSIEIPANESISFDFASYVGIREIDGMSFRDKNLDPKITATSVFAGLNEKIDKSFNQGLTTPFRNGIVWVLKKIYLIVPNYGWCIILFGIILKLVFYPLNQKQAESMKKLQELNPQIKSINEKFANDPAKKQEKIMELYKKNGTNPMSGCLPMVIQIPIFIALYTAFSDTIDLWHSPFLWIRDLSEPDTIYTTPAFLGMTGFAINVLPLFMVGTQYFQTKLTSVATDPNQQTMMYVLPFIMLYFFWTMPSGVVLYWTVQNLLSILQQLYTNSKTKKKS